MTMKAVYSVRQDGDLAGLRDWWAVYRDRQIVHYWPTKAQAQAHADGLADGLPREAAIAMVDF